MKEEMRLKPKDFKLRLDDAAILMGNEDKIKYINGYSYGKERTTEFRYESIGEEGRIPFIVYGCYQKYEELVHGFSTRFGGVSKGHLSSMNLSFSRGDNPESVMENHRRLGKAIGYDYKRLVFSDQVHNTVIRAVTEEDAGRGIVNQDTFSGVDGLITNCRNLPLITFYADCVPLFAYDPKVHAIGLAHSGWRGTVDKIGIRLIEAMRDVYGSDARDVICAIGPSICRDCYEVSADVIEMFERAFSKEQCESLYYKKENGKYQLDLHQACFYNFLDAGVLQENIAKPDLCTCCNNQILFSHRASKGMRGNLGAVMMLRDIIDEEA